MPAEKGLLGDSPRRSRGAATSKMRLGVMVKQGARVAKSSNQKAELEELKVRYQNMCRQMKVLGKALEQRHEALVQTGRARASLAKAFSAMTSDEIDGAGEASPLRAQTGEWSAEDGTATGPGPSYAHAMSTIDLQAEGRAEEFKLFAVDYFAQWQDAVTTRINSDMKKTDQLRRDADHYQAKVESLATQKKRQEEKKKPVKADLVDKLKRNQEKLEEANIVYENAALDLFLLMEELVDRSWRDMHPLFLHVLEWDVSVTRDDADVMGDLHTMIDELKHLEDMENVSSNRTDDIRKESAKNLSTRPQGVDATNLSFGDGSGSKNNSFDASPSKPVPVPVEIDNFPKMPTPDETSSNDKEEKDDIIPQFAPAEVAALQFDPTKEMPVLSTTPSRGGGAQDTNPFDSDSDDDDAIKPASSADESDKNPFADGDDDDDNNKNPFGDDDDDDKNPFGDSNNKNPFGDDDDEVKPSKTNPFDDDDDGAPKALRRPSIE